MDPNSHFGVFRTIRVHLGPFGCFTTLSAKRVKLVQKFVPQSRVGIFRNERTRSTPLESKLLFSRLCTIWVHLGLIDCLPILSAKRVKLVQKFVHEVALEFFATNAPDPPLWILNSCSGVFQTNFAAFGIVWLAHKNSVQNRPTGAKVHATKSRRNFTQ